MRFCKLICCFQILRGKASAVRAVGREELNQDVVPFVDHFIVVAVGEVFEILVLSEEVILFGRSTEEVLTQGRGGQG
jgi:hypothetical protein